MSRVGLKRISNSSQETVLIGRELARCIPNAQLVCLSGDLGAGKTTLTKGFVSELTGLPEERISSPTFQYLHIYEGNQRLHHLDCYRIKDKAHFLSLGLEEYLEELSLVEWPERISPLLPKVRSEISITYLGKNKRLITYEQCSL